MIQKILDTMPGDLHIEKYADLAEIISAGDELSGNSTYFLHDTLQNITKLVERNTKGSLNRYVYETFQHSNTVYSNDKSLDKNIVVKFNAFASMMESIMQDGIKHPMNISYFANSSWSLHPGNTRLFFEHLYEEPVTAIITDYKGTLLEDYPTYNFILPEEADWTVNITDLKVFVNDGAWFPLPNAHVERSGLNKFYYKEVKECYTPDTLRHPYNSDPPIVFRKNKDKVFVNDKQILQKKRKYWELVYVN